MVSVNVTKILIEYALKVQDLSVHHRTHLKPQLYSKWAYWICLITKPDSFI